MLPQYILIISVHIFTVTTNTFIIKLAGAVESTTLQHIDRRLLRRSGRRSLRSMCNIGSVMLICLFVFTF